MATHLGLQLNERGKTNFMYNNEIEPPWNTLGESVKGCFKMQDILERVPDMGMEVEKRQLFTELNGDYQLVDSWGIFRTDNDKFLGSVGNQYTVIQIAQAFDFVDTLLENIEGAHYDTAGLLYGGEQFFLSATIPYSIAPDRAPEDKTHCYLMFTSSHDGSLSATTKLTTVRTVCYNTLAVALKGQGYGTLKVRHSKGGQDKLDRAKRLITGVTQSVETLKDKFNILANRKVSANQNTAIMNKIFGDDWKDSTQKRNQVERIATLFDSNDNGAFPEIKDSAYSMLQSITNWVDHDRAVRKTDRVNDLNENQIRTQNAVFNGGDALKQQALEVVLAATKDSDAMPDVKHYYQSADVNKTDNKLDSIMSMIA